jgi:hypothetical protein
MDQLRERLGRAVPRDGAPRNLRITLLSFAASVILTRLFLSLTGYPQVGNQTLHISHLLWGGLLLFLAALLMMMFANNSVFALGGLMTGFGIGLFIDEVGKFITRTNDYFYPAAAPIVYALFLLVVLLYLEFRRGSIPKARQAMYQALERLQELVDRYLAPSELSNLKADLERACEEEDRADLRHLCQTLLDFLLSGSVSSEVPRLNFWKRLEISWRAFAHDHLGRPRERAVLVGGLAALGTVGLIALTPSLLALHAPVLESPLLGQIPRLGRVATGGGTSWYWASCALEGSTGMLLLLAALLMLFGRERSGTGLAYLGLWFALTAVNLLAFYFEQFKAILPALVEFLLLLGIMDYRKVYLSRDPSSGPPSSV